MNTSRTILLLITMLFGVASFGQKNTSEKPLGFAQASNKNHTELTVEFIVEKADSFRVEGDTWQAEYWYAQLVEKSDEAIYRLYYALALQSNGKYDKAKTWFLNYDSLLRNGHEINKGAFADLDEKGYILSLECDKAKNVKDLKETTINQLEGVNSRQLDFSPIFYQNGLVFVSTRGLRKQSKLSEKVTGKKELMDLFFVEINEDGSLGTPYSFSKKLNSKKHEGPLTFSYDESMMLFTRNSTSMWRNDQGEDGKLNLKIYSAKFESEKGDWTNIQELPLNVNQKTMCHPTLSADGKKLYFAADLDGGFGGVDLYVAHWNGIKWGKPINLGAEVNSKRDEIFPYIHDDGTLYFSSNRREGLGGLDVYMAQQTTRNGKTIWIEAENMGAPINSKKDDFGLILNVTKTNGFLTSNRKGGTGRDDIYGFTMPIQKSTKENTIPVEMEYVVTQAQPTKTIQSPANPIVKSDNKEELAVNIKKTNKPTRNLVEPAKVIKEERKDNKEAVVMNTEPLVVPVEATEVEVDIAKNDTRELVAINIPKENEVSYAARGAEKSKKIVRTRSGARKHILVNGIIINQELDKGVSEATIKIINQNTGEEVLLTSSTDGKFMTSLDCNCNYGFFGAKTAFRDVFEEVKLINSPCSGEKVVALYLKPTTFKKRVTHIEKNLTLDEVTINAKEARAGNIILLDKIKYDYNQVFLTNNAKMELDKLVDLLKRFPSMEIEIGAHTDSKGNALYNTQLSQERAEAVKNYVMTKGISPNRLKAQGYGEIYLKNDCDDNRICLEEMHKENRRIEVLITKFNQLTTANLKYNK